MCEIPSAPPPLNTTPTSAATATAAIAAATTTTGRTIFARTGLVHGQGAALKIFVIESLDSLAGFLVRTHLDEGEAAWFSRHAVLHDVHGDDGAGGGKMVLKIVFRGVMIDVSDE